MNKSYRQRVISGKALMFRREIEKHGSISKAAIALGVHRNTITRTLQKAYGRRPTW